MWKVPLAWFQLTYQTKRFLVASASISFAIMLMFMQLIFRDALYNSVTLLHQNLRGDLVMLHQETTSLVSFTNFSRRRLYQSLKLEEVEAVSPIYYAVTDIKTVYDKVIDPKQSSTDSAPETIRVGASRLIGVFGINPNQSPLDFATLDANLDRIKLTDVFLFDQNSRPEYGPIEEDIRLGRKPIAEINGERLNIDGVVDFIGPSFAIDGNLITSDTNFQRVVFPDPDQIGLGMISLREGSHPQTVVNTLNRTLPADVKVMTREDYINLEIGYWARTTPIGFLFSLGVAVGFAVGVMVVYQVLYGEVTEHIPDYMLLKAKGYRDAYFVGVLFQGALMLAVAGYIPGYMLAWLFCRFANASTGIAVTMEFNRSLFVLLLTICMCVVSGLLTARKLQEADPVDLL